MCGIFGVWHLDGAAVESTAVCRARDALARRGPDDCGAYVDASVGLAHRRLSILDLSPLGRMPMANEDETLWATFNGEIYNFRELRAELEAAGHRFRSHTDSEVIVHAYEQWGTGCFARFDGMFAIGIWDKRRQQMILARDPHGKKPLFYYLRPGHLFLFASTLSALVAWPDFPRQVNEASVYDYFKVGYFAAPDTIFRDTRKLRPGCFAVLDREGNWREEPYWSLADLAAQPATICDERVALDELDRLLREAVRKRLVADVPLGMFLSGGVDSSLVVAIMREVAPQPLQTYTIGFSAHQFDESRYAEQVAATLGTPNTVFRMSGNDLLRFLPDVPHYFDEPMADFSLFPTLAVSRLAREHVTVVLTGDGGDEFFGGYDKYLAMAFFERYSRWFGPRIRRAIAGASNWIPIERYRRVVQLSGALDTPTFCGSYSNLSRYAGLATLIPDERIGQLPEAAVARFIRALDQRSPTAAAMFYDAARSMIDAILVKVDRATMAFALEARCPLLDRRLTEFAVGVHLDLKIRGSQNKYLLKKLLERYLPKKLIYRPKMGFSPPLRDWFRKELRGLLTDALAPEMVRRRGLFKPDGVQRLVDQHLRGDADHSHPLWALLTLEMWMGTYVDSPAVAAAV